MFITIRFYSLMLLVFQGVYGEYYSVHNNISNISDTLTKNIYDFNIWEYPQNIYHSLNYSNVINNKCNLDIQKVLQGFINSEEWALQLLDSNAKLGSGILRGNIKSLGHYDECVETEGPDLTGQYCLSTLHVNSDNKEWNNIIHTMTMGRIEGEILKDKGILIPDLVPRLSEIQLGVCVPSSCSAQNVQMLMNSVFQNLTQNIPLEISAQVEPGNCYVLKSEPWTSEDVYFILVISALVFLALAATVYTINYPKHMVESTGQQILRSFSINENWERLMNTKSTGTFTSLEGIRVLSTLWVILSHISIFMMQEPWINKDKLYKSVSHMVYMPLVNNALPVETFLMTSGLLRGYYLLRDLQNHRHDFISSVWKRYLRLTPAAAFMIAFYATVATRFGSGPNWYKIMVQPTKEACRTNWMYNLLYLNNYVTNDMYCGIQTWYLAMDMQLFLLAPLIVYPIWRWPQKAIHIITTVLIIAILIPFFFILQNSAIPTILPGASNMQIMQYQQNIHITTQCRAAAYVVGLGLAYIMFQLKDIKIKLSKIAVATGWSLCILMLYAIAFGPFKLFQYDYVYNVWEMALYGALHRPVFAIAVAWIIFACHLGYGGLINNLLSAKIFQPLSKLSYCMFLTHFFVLMVKTGKIRTPLYMDELDLVYNFFGCIILTLLASVFIHLIIEAPVMELIKIMQNKTIRLTDKKK